jgi:hypothetical protein
VLSLALVVKSDKLLEALNRTRATTANLFGLPKNRLEANSQDQDPFFGKNSTGIFKQTKKFLAT